MLSAGRSEHGDTIIEVLLAITIFSMVAVGALTMMNSGAAAAQRSLEITLVRQEMDAQAELLRFIHDEYIAEKTAGLATGPATTRWQSIASTAEATAFSAMVSGSDCHFPEAAAHPFIVNTKTGQIQELTSIETPSTYAQLRYNALGGFVGSDGMWVESVRVNQTTDASGATTPGFVDFHIRACWAAIGQAQPATLGTIVRLYEP